MAEIATCIVPEGLETAEKFADIAEREHVDLTIVGPETLLVEGIVDHFQERGLSVFGPTAAAARLEGSKTWAKAVMRRVGIPTAEWQSFTDRDTARVYAQTLNWRCAVKADGLAAGKGSFVCTTEEQVDDALNVLLAERRYHTQVVLIEELLDGQEVSVFAFSDGRTVLPFGAAQDHKRAHDRDKGPNTGGMGAYSPVEHMHVALEFAVRVFQPLVDDLAASGTPYVGVLYAGAIVTDMGPKILEFNCRLGDPEAEVLLCRLDSDLAEILLAATSGQLHKVPKPTWSQKDALCVVIATDTYPASQDFGTPIHGLAEAERLPDVRVFHAGTMRDPSTGGYVTAGGRILTVTGLGDGLEEARSRAYDAVALINFDRAYFRHDIGTKAIGTARAWNPEWRQPPTWEVQRSNVSLAIGRIADELQELQSEDPTKIPEALERLSAGLYRIRSTLQPAAPPASRVPNETSDKSRSLASDRLAHLEAEFDDILDRMGEPDSLRAVMAVFGARPHEFGTTVRRDGDRAPNPDKA